MPSRSTEIFEGTRFRSPSSLAEQSQKPLENNELTFRVMMDDQISVVKYLKANHS